MRKAFEDSWVILQRHSERSDLMPGEWNRVEAEVLEKLRSAYRFQWNLPYSREVLASCSHLMICSDKDVYPNFTLDLDLSLDVGGRVVTTLLRLARRVYREYQRALWDTEDLEELNEKEEEMVKKVTEVFESRRRRLGREAALAKAEKAMIKLRSQPYTDEDVIEEAQDKIEEFRYEVNEAKSHEDSAASEVVTTSAKESSFHVFGDVGVMLIDTRWSRVNGDGSQSGGNDLLSGEQWNEFELLLTVSTVRALVVCVEYPVVQMDRENTIRDACGGEHNHTPFHECNSTWALNEGQQKKLLEMLFGWKKREKWRQVLILSGGLCYGLDTVIKIRNSNWKVSVSVRETAKQRVKESSRCMHANISGSRQIRQLTTGPLTDRPSEIRLGRIGSVLEGYYEFKHDFLPHQRNYVEALISTEYEGDSKIEAQLVGQYFARVGCLCGPVIGKVTSKSAIILIEVDHEAPISCMVADVISGAVLRTTKLLPARQPYAFVFDGLESDRHYTVRFEGFVNADDRMGSFTTQKDYEQLFKSTEGRVNGDFKLNFIFMSGELKGGGGVGNSVLVKQSETEKEGGGGISEMTAENDKDGVWDTIANISCHPWSGLNVVFHMGGQVDMDKAVSAAIALLSRAEREPEDSSSRQTLVAEALDHIREAYRSSWSLPGTRESLGNGCHLMLRGGLDFGR